MVGIKKVALNLIVLVCGILSLLVMISVASSKVQLDPGEDFIEPIMIFVFAILCNLGYTLGWLTEIFIKRSLTYGTKMFKVGLYFTLFWIFIPTTIWIIIATYDVVKNL